MDDADHDEGYPQDQSGALVEERRGGEGVESRRLVSKCSKNVGQVEEVMLDGRTRGKKKQRKTLQWLLEFSVFTAALGGKNTRKICRADSIKARRRAEDSERKSCLLSH